MSARSGDNVLMSRYTTLASAHDIETTEKAHRDFLWRLEELESK